MQKAIARLVLSAAVGAALSLSPAAAQQSPTEPEIDYPESPNGHPMEAIWDAAQGTEGGEITQTGPYRVSRWGDIVIRGRPEGDRIVSALSLIQCGKTKNAATQVVLIGEAPDDLCDGVTALKPGSTNIVSGRNYSLYGQSTGWTLVTFVQKVGLWVNGSGMPPVDKTRAGSWGVNQLGAVYHDENGKHVFYAPGETVDLGHGVTFVVKPVMEEDELNMFVVTAGMRSFSDLPKDFGRQKDKTEKPPMWFIILFLAVPLLVIGGIGYGIFRYFRRRKERKLARIGSQMTGALPANE